jgi:ribonuclease BN (tRNA processing enzyme)
MPTYWVFSGDTERNPDFWKRVNQIKVGMLVIETTFSNSERALASRSMHLCAEVLLQELQLIAQKNSYPIYITHAKPAEMGAVMQEVELLNRVSRLDESSVPQKRLHQIAWLAAGQDFDV